MSELVSWRQLDIASFLIGVAGLYFGLKTGNDLAIGLAVLALGATLSHYHLRKEYNEVLQKVAD